MAYNKKTRITRKTIFALYDIIYSFVRKIKYDHVSSFAGHAALFLLMSLFPMAMFLISIFNYIPIESGQLTRYVFAVVPNGLRPLINQVFAEAYAESTTVLKSFTMIVMLFCASRGVYAIIIGMNAVYGIRETRGMVVLYALAIIYVIVFFVVIGLTMIMIVLGNNIFSKMFKIIPHFAAFYSLFKYGKYVVMPILLVGFFMLVYMNVPNRRSQIRYEIPGAMFSTVVWMAYSWGFSFYISNYANYSVTYGSLATIVIFILWLYVTMNIVFIGAEINVVLRKFAEYGYNYELVRKYYQEAYKNE
jgi:membrane protein